MLRLALPSECWPVNLLMSVLLPTDGKPINPTLATPVLATSKPAAGCQISALLSEPVFLTASATSTRRWCKKLPFQFCKLRLQLSQMIACGLVLLRLGHLVLDAFDLYSAEVLALEQCRPERADVPYPRWSPS